MRVLHVGKFLHRRGGAEAHLLDLADLQRARGDEVAFFGMTHPDNPRLPFERHFAPYAEFDPPPAGLRARAGLAGRMVWSPAAARGMRAVLARFRPDVIHLHNIYHQLSPSVIAAGRRAGVPMVMTVHDYKLACPTYRFLDHDRICTACIHGGLRQAVRRRCRDGSLAASTMAAIELGTHRLLGAYAAVATFVCPSSFVLDRLTEAGVFPDRLVHVPNFTPLEVPRRSGAGRGVAYAGRLSPEKGVDVLIRAAGLIDGPAAGGAVLDIIGDGPERSALAALADRVAPGRVRFHGRLAATDVHDVVSAARVTALPARWLENQPLAVLESFAAQVPVIGSRLGGIPELVVPGETGTLVPHDDPVALAGALRAYLTDPDRSVREGAAARAYAESHHAPAAHLRSLDAVYAAAIAALGGAGAAG
ncbi:MAG: glycosyltransferase [Dermatophilaceae bacterium]